MYINAEYYSFSLLSLLSMIKGTSIKEVKINTSYNNVHNALLLSNPGYIEINGKYKQERYGITMVIFV